MKMEGVVRKARKRKRERDREREREERAAVYIVLKLNSFHRLPPGSIKTMDFGSETRSKLGSTHWYSTFSLAVSRRTELDHFNSGG